MRNLVLVLLLLVAGATWWFACGGGRSNVVTEPALVPGASHSPGGNPRTAVEDGALPVRSDLPPARPDSSSASARGAPHAIEGTVLDRFGFPLAGERIFLLRGDQDHPPADAVLSDYSTTLSSSEGRFVMTFRTEGPWRLAIGPPGQPRFPPSEPRTLTETIRAEVIVPGTASVRVALEALPEVELPLALELLALNEPVAPKVEAAPPEPPRPDPVTVPERPGDGRQQSDEELKAQTEESGGDAGGDGAGNRSGPVRSRRAVSDSGAGEDASPPELEGLQPPDESGKRPDRDGAGAGSVVAAPRESWRTLNRHQLSDEERAAGTVTFPNLPVGGILRLRLWVGRERIEGTRRFSLRPDSLTEVRILSMSTGAEAAVNYLTSLELPSPEESPAGVHWLE